MADVLPCPQCQSTKTLSHLRAKRARLKRRIEREKRKRYPPPPPSKGKIHGKASGFHIKNSMGGTKIHPAQIHGRTTSTIHLAPSDPTFSGDLCIEAPSLHGDQAGTVSINEALLDVCMDCGTFYASNAHALRDEIEEEIIKMDPLMALAEIRDADES